MKLIENQTLDKERTLYGEENISVRNCSFDGPADGESALKECREIEVTYCFFNLRYPFWHNNGLKIQDSEMTELCRAALWYSENVEITDTKMHGIKALRECSNIRIENCDIISPEFGWFVNRVQMKHSTVESEYFMMHSSEIDFYDVTFNGKYSFQYITNAVFENCRFDTKDAFWHSRNVTVKNSTVKGEYLAWYSEGLTLINCKIIGTQPFCYCKNLTLIDCEMEDTDLSFEKSEVQATITTPVISIKNPLWGWIQAPNVGKIIVDDEKSKGRVIIGEQAGKELKELLCKNKRIAEQMIKNEIPQLTIRPFENDFFIALEVNIIGSIEEMLRMLEEQQGVKLILKRYKENILVLFDAACSNFEMIENLEKIKQGILAYEEFCLKRC